MSSSPPPDANKPTVNAEAGLLGGSSGTLLALLANNLSDDHWFKSWLLILAPAVSVAITYLWSRVRFLVDAYLEERATRIAYQRAKTALEETLGRQGISREHKRLIRRELEELEAAFILSNSARVKERLRPKAPRELNPPADSPMGPTEEA